jgi:F0F1-type ATP synthase gamma subunit
MFMAYSPIRRTWISRYFARIYFEDNTSTIAATENPVSHSKLKHLEVIYHQIRDFIKDHKVVVAHIDTQNQLADLLTKPHSPARHHQLVGNIIELFGS